MRGIISLWLLLPFSSAASFRVRPRLVSSLSIVLGDFLTSDSASPPHDFGRGFSEAQPTGRKEENSEVRQLQSNGF
jgi:hypothetical protein